MRIQSTIAILLVAGTAIAAPPTNCTPGPVALQAANPGDVAIDHVNETKCKVNEVRAKSDQTDRASHVCVSNQVNASRRKMFVLTAPFALNGSESITISIKDSIKPALAELSGTFVVNGTGEIDVWVFNRDAGRTRPVQACATITR